MRGMVPTIQPEIDMAKNSVMAKEESEWRAEDDLRTLTRAEEIKKDPKRLKAAQEMAKKKLESAAMVVGMSADTD